jgi:hypothetical protein
MRASVDNADDKNIVMWTNVYQTVLPRAVFIQDNAVNLTDFILN